MGDVVLGTLQGIAAAAMAEPVEGFAERGQDSTRPVEGCHIAHGDADHGDEVIRLPVADHPCIPQAYFPLQDGHAKDAHIMDAHPALQLRPRVAEGPSSIGARQLQMTFPQSFEGSQHQALEPSRFQRFALSLFGCVCTGTRLIQSQRASQ